MLYTILYTVLSTGLVILLYTYVKVAVSFLQKHYPPCLLSNEMQTILYTSLYHVIYTVLYTTVYIIHHALSIEL